MANEASVGGFFSETISLLTDASRDFMIYVAVVGGLQAVGVLFGLTETSTMLLSTGFSVNTADGPASALFDLVSAVVALYGGYWLLTRYLAARNRFDGEGRFWAYFGLSILAGIGVVLGLILLIIPGLFLLVRWSAASGYLVGSHKSVGDALSSSWEATKGHGWAILGGGFAMIFAVIIAAGVIGGVAGVLGTTVGGVVSALAEAAATAVMVAYGIAVYSVIDQNPETLGEVFA